MPKSKKKLKVSASAQKHQPNNQKQLLAVGQQFQGPIPSPQVLAGYENLLPGSADRILSMAESETKHRQAMEKTAVEAEVNGLKAEATDTKRGQFCGLIIGLTAIIAGSYTAVNGSAWAGGFIGAGGVIGLVTAFIGGRKARKNDNNNQQTKDTQSQS